MTFREVDNDEEGQASEIKTVPPPAGESDAYNAPTRVADLDANAYAKLLEHYAGPQTSASEAPALSPEDIAIPVAEIEIETDTSRSPLASRPPPAFPEQIASPPPGGGAALLTATERSLTDEPSPPSSVVPFTSPPRSPAWALFVWLIAVSVVVTVAALVAIWLTP